MDDQEYDEHPVRRNGRLTAILSLLVAVSAPADDIRDELVQASRRYSPEFTRTLEYDDGSPAAVFRDLNGDGLLDIAVVAVLDEPDVSARVETLRQPSRVFRLNETEPLFVVETYFAGDEAVQTVELGRQPALGALELLPLSPNAFPVGILVELRSLAGIETNLLIYSEGGKLRRERLYTTDRERHQIVDLDVDGSLDIVQSRRLPEAGRGYETFIELLTLHDGDYTVSRSFPVVRSLTTFLEQAASLMRESRWPELGAMVDASGAAPEVLADAFPGVAEEEELAGVEFDFPRDSDTITNVVFPTVMENPFPFPYLGQTMGLLFRVECCDELPRLFSATIRMSANPFEPPGFQFLTEQ